MQSIILRKNEERRLLAGHLWVYSNEIDTKISPLKNFTPGEIVEIRSSRNKILGKGYINPQTLLCARLLTRDPQDEIGLDFFVNKIEQALSRRELCFGEPFYRLIFSEGDGLSGLVVDRFGDTLVLQLNTAGMENLKDIILEALINVIKPSAILLRNNSSIRVTEGLDGYIKAVYGEPQDIVEIRENGMIFGAAIGSGQKTGWFYDQRFNRMCLVPYVKDKDVLDLFSYSGGFGITAAVHGAASVTCVDASAPALEQLKSNADLNKVSNKITSICQDAFLALQELKDSKKDFDVIVLDPPAFIKRQKDISKGQEAYLRLHELAIKLLKPSGILCTTSCSLHLSRDMLLDILRKTMVKSRREVSILEQLHQSKDHPVHPAIAETNYLKGFIAQVGG